MERGCPEYAQYIRQRKRNDSPRPAPGQDNLTTQQYPDPVTRTHWIVAGIGTAFVLVAAATAALAVSYARAARRVEAGPRASGVVVSVRPGTGVLQPGHVRVRFPAAGGVVEADIPTTIEPHLAPGAAVLVAHDPGDPRRARLVGAATGLNEDPTAKLVFAAIASAALGLLLVGTSRSPRLQRLLALPPANR